MTVLKIMCGCPAAGKSTYIKNHAKPEDLVVSRDAIRRSLLEPGIPYFSKDAEVFSLFCQAINTGLSYPVIWADATHLNNGSIKKLLNNIYVSSFEKICFVCIETSLEKCLERNNKRTGIEKVPEQSIISMYNSYTRPKINDFYLNIPIEIEVVKGR